MSLYKLFGKRAFDVVGSAAALILFLPLIICVAAVIGAKLGRPTLFIQERSGLRGRPFRIVKFRSMIDMLDAHGRARTDEERLTPFGVWLRSSSLDEIPAFWNVFKGEMSLVGPRPLHTRYDPLYNREQVRRLDVRPGITGWAQVNGRNALSWPEKFALDVWYVENQSFFLDLKILLATVLAVIHRRGVSPDGLEIMPEFRGETATPSSCHSFEIQAERSSHSD
jgi:lipopolysaccharide/colanic/teichoic acid biosynthesis glycosyltransferase